MIKLLLSINNLDEEFKKMVKQLENFCKVDIVGLNNFSLKDYDIFVGKMLSEKQLKTANKLKIIFAYKTGVDNFPLKALDKQNIKLINSHASAKLIAEYSFSLLLNLVNHINKFDNDLRNSVWYDENDFYWESVYDKKVGLLGYGKIGKAIHSILKRNKISTYTIESNDEKYSNINLVDNYIDLIKNCDVIIASLPKTKETNNLFNKKTFKLMKNKYLINVGRSNVINQKDLYNALENNLIKGVAIDTWDNKPKTKTEKLYPSKYNFNKFSNIILLPHSATRTKDGHKLYVDDTANKIINYIKNNKIIDIVDLKKGY